MRLAEAPTLAQPSIFSTFWFLYVGPSYAIYYSRLNLGLCYWHVVQSRGSNTNLNVRSYDIFDINENIVTKTRGHQWSYMIRRSGRLIQQYSFHQHPVFPFVDSPDFCSLYWKHFIWELVVIPCAWSSLPLLQFDVMTYYKTHVYIFVLP